MKSKILKIVLGLILFSALFITVSSAATTVKEDVQDYDDIVYIIGSTRFDSDVIITAQRAANAGVSEAKRLVAMGKPDEIENLNLKTYCYIPDFDEWYEIQEEAKSLNKEEIKNIEENLNIFFVNNEEKILEFNHNANKEDINILTDGVTFDGKKFSVPATKTEFKFLENNVEAIVKTKTDKQNKDELDYGNFEIKYKPVVSFKMPTEFIAGTSAEFSVSTTANGYKGTMVVGTGGISDSTAIQKLEYYEVKDGKWYEMPSNGQFGTNSGFPLSDATSKFRVTFKKAGNYDVTFAIKSVETNEIMASAIAKINVKSEKTIAKVGTQYFEDLKSALLASKNSSTPVVLLKDVTITKDDTKISLEPTEKASYVLDLNGKTITAERFLFNISKNAELTLKNGTITKNVVDGAPVAQIEYTGILNIEKDLTINAVEYGVTVWEDATLNCSGTINLADDGYAISGNGGETANTTVNINGGKIAAPNGAAIYHPQTGTLNINGGELTANTVIGIKAGSLNILGGKLTATGEKVTPKEKGNGFNLTGDVVYIEENLAYKNNIHVNITGGTLTSTNGYVMQELNTTKGTAKERKPVITGKYTTRITVSSKITAFTDASEAAFETANGDRYIAKSLEFVMAKPALNGGTVKLLKDINLKTAVTVNKEVTLDLNNCNLTVTEDKLGNGVFYVTKNGNLTINGNGTIDGTGKNIYNVAIKADMNGKVTINGGTYTNTKIQGNDSHYDLIYAQGNAQIIINGGRFEGKTPAWLLNILDDDRKTASIKVKGGEFVGFDPANNKAEGEGTNFLADRDKYKSVENDGVYTVVPVE